MVSDIVRSQTLSKVKGGPCFSDLCPVCRVITAERDLPRSPASSSSLRCHHIPRGFCHHHRKQLFGGGEHTISVASLGMSSMPDPRALLRGRENPLGFLVFGNRYIPFPLFEVSHLVEGCTGVSSMGFAVYISAMTCTSPLVPTISSATSEGAEDVRILMSFDVCVRKREPCGMSRSKDRNPFDNLAHRASELYSPRVPDRCTWIAVPKVSRSLCFSSRSLERIHLGHP